MGVLYGGLYRRETKLWTHWHGIKYMEIGRKFFIQIIQGNSKSIGRSVGANMISFFLPPEKDTNLFFLRISLAPQRQLLLFFLLPHLSFINFLCFTFTPIVFIEISFILPPPPPLPERHSRCYWAWKWRVSHRHCRLKGNRATCVAPFVCLIFFILYDQGKSCRLLCTVHIYDQGKLWIRSILFFWLSNCFVLCPSCNDQGEIIQLSCIAFVIFLI